MIASVLHLDPRSMGNLKIRDAYEIHKVIYTLFPGEKRDFLYLDKGGNRGERLILILSEKLPLEPDEGFIETKEVPEDYLNHAAYAFEVRLNPVVRKTGSKSPTPVTGSEELKSWFLKRQNEWGFSAQPDSLEIDDTGVQSFEKGKKKILHNKATFRGLLEVTDRSLFTKSFCRGIGRGKAFGFGLLQIKPIKK